MEEGFSPDAQYTVHYYHPDNGRCKGVVYGYLLEKFWETLLRAGCEIELTLRVF